MIIQLASRERKRLLAAIPLKIDLKNIMSNQQDQEKASDAKADVDLTAAGRGVWLVKVSNIFLPMTQFSVVSTKAFH